MPKNTGHNQHRFIQRTNSKLSTAEVNKIAACILNHYTGQKFSVTRYKSLKTFRLGSRTNSAPPLGVFRFVDFVQHIFEHRSFHPEAFKLPPLHSIWLDGVPVFSINGPVFVTDVEGPLPFVSVAFGEEFPVKPSVDREGVAFGTFQIALQENILKLFNTLVDSSSLALEVDHPNWFHELRMLINDCVTIVDITLHQLYYKAQYNPKQGWGFDPRALKKRHNMRIMDKFEWIGKITGHGFADAVEEKKEFRFLKNVRNHINHFDPPCFAFTIEDVVHWLNRVPCIGRLLWKMRVNMEEPLTTGIVEMIMLSPVMFVPRNPSTPRVKQGDGVGYKSSVWPAKQ